MAAPRDGCAAGRLRRGMAAPRDGWRRRHRAPRRSSPPPRHADRRFGRTRLHVGHGRLRPRRSGQQRQH
eukprot:6430308-Prymnesium_polylepis.1